MPGSGGPSHARRGLARVASVCALVALVALAAGASTATANAATQIPNPAVLTANCTGGMAAAVPVNYEAARELVPKKYTLDVTADGKAQLILGTKFCNYDATGFSPAVRNVYEVRLLLKLTGDGLYDGLRNFFVSDDPNANEAFKVAQRLTPSATQPRAMNVGTGWGAHSGWVIETGQSGFRWTEVYAAPAPYSAEGTHHIYYEGEDGYEYVESIHQSYSFQGWGLVRVQADPASLLADLIGTDPVTAGAQFVATESLSASIQHDD